MKFSQLFKRFGRQERPEQVDGWFAWESARRVEGFQNWLVSMPPSGTWVEATRREWPMLRVWQSGHERPEFNVADLWWRACRGDANEGSILELSLPGDN